MKLTKTKLKQLIKEEIETAINTIQETGDQGGHRYSGIANATIVELQRIRKAIDNLPSAIATAIAAHQHVQPPPSETGIDGLDKP